MFVTGFTSYSVGKFDVMASNIVRVDRNTVTQNGAIIAINI